MDRIWGYMTGDVDLEVEVDDGDGFGFRTPVCPALGVCAGDAMRAVLLVLAMDMEKKARRCLGV